LNDPLEISRKDSNINDLKDHVPDYHEGGDNWALPENLNRLQQTPIDLPPEEEIEYDEKVKLTLCYNELKHV
jgi:hypothetical protein